MNTYIKKDHKGFYVNTIDEIDATLWAGQIGTTYEDFQNNKWILLSSEQVKFHEDNPSANILEVLSMQMNPEQPRTLEDAKKEKLAELITYDSSNAINSFDIVMGDNVMSTWITPEQRSNYKNSLDSAELLGLEEVHPVFNGIQLTLDISTAKMALAQIQIYADRCYIITETHKATINSLNTIEEVDNYEYRTSYPEKLVFTI